jgi:DNA-binding response OmpR family regulator
MSRILLVEDDHGLRGVLRIVLQESGHEVAEADCGTDVERLVASHKPDLVITDVMMPGCDGVEVVRSLSRRTPAVPILAISGGGTSHGLHLLELVEKLGAADTLRKPFTNSALLAKINGILERQAAASVGGR